MRLEDVSNSECGVTRKRQQGASYYAPDGPGPDRVGLASGAAVFAFLRHDSQIGRWPSAYPLCAWKSPSGFVSPQLRHLFEAMA